MTPAARDVLRLQGQLSVLLGMEQELSAIGAPARRHARTRAAIDRLRLELAHALDTRLSQCGDLTDAIRPSRVIV